ncbi:MAG: Phase flagellin [Planctomycetota bacterium]|jgi:flagellin
MGLRINNNIASVNGHRNLTKNDAMVSKSLERLSSGLKINRAADDAAGLIISEQMRAQLSGLNQAIANSEQAVTLVQTAEGALDEVNTLLTKARSLAVHAANEGVNDTNQLIADQGELDNIINSITRIADTTQFGTKKLLDGTLSNGTSNSSAISGVTLGGDYNTLVANGDVVRGYHTLEVTAVATQAVSDIGIASGVFETTTGGAVDLQTADGDAIATESFRISINGANIDIASGTTKDQVVQQLNALGNRLGFTASVTGAGASGNIRLTAKDYGSAFEFDIQFVSSNGPDASSLAVTQVASGTDAAATLYLYTGANGAGGTATSGAGATAQIDLTGNGLNLVSTGGSRVVLTSALATGFVYGAVNGNTAGAKFQIGANANQTATVELASVKATQLGIGGSGSYGSLNALKGSSLVSGNATEALKVIDKAIDDITVTRGKLGAFQANTLETNISSLRVTSENLTAAESTIRDTDFAAESARFTKYNILVQSSTAMMAQANQLPQNVLQLLG